MISSRSSFSKLGWVIAISASVFALFVLSINVNAQRNEIRQIEDKIVRVKRETVYLDTEFATLANQQQLREWNDIDFGYGPPAPRQFIDGSRELTSLGDQRGVASNKGVDLVEANNASAPGGQASDALTQQSQVLAGALDRSSGGGASGSSSKPSKADAQRSLDSKLISLRPAVRGQTSDNSGEGN